MNPTNDYLIWSLEHNAWWAPNERGYVRTAGAAGRYGKLRAEEICEQANNAVMHEVAIPENAL